MKLNKDKGCRSIFGNTLLLYFHRWAFICNDVKEKNVLLLASCSDRLHILLYESSYALNTERE